MGDVIELLQETLIEENPQLAMDVYATSSRLRIQLGWHYVLDLIWLLREVDLDRPATILDAGGGTGVLQYLLADRGYEVISADMVSRQPRKDLERMYRFGSMGSDEEIDHVYLDHLGVAKTPGNASRPSLRSRARSLLRTFRNTARKEPVAESAPDMPEPPKAELDENERVVFYRCNLASMNEIPDNSIDAVVSVSAIEHNPPETSNTIMRELERITRPGGKILLTVSAGKEGVTTHEESHSYVLDETALIDTYNLVNPRSNFEDFDAVSERLSRSNYLRKWLASMYYNGGTNGMPWGIWSPSYLPVGIKKTMDSESVPV